MGANRTPLVSIYDDDPSTLHMLVRHLGGAHGSIIVEVVVADGHTRFDLFAGALDIAEPSLLEPTTTPPDPGDHGVGIEGRQRAGREHDVEHVASICRDILSEGPATTLSVMRQVNGGGWNKSFAEVGSVLEDVRQAGEVAFDGERWSLVPPTPAAPASGARKTAVSVRDLNDEQVVAAVRNAGEITLSNLSRAFEVAPGSMSYRLDKLVSSGALIRDEVSKLYRLSLP